MKINLEQLTKMKINKFILGLVCILLLLIACTPNHKGKLMEKDVTIGLGLTGLELFKQAQAKTDDKSAPSIAGFLDLRWGSKNPGNVHFEHGRYSLTFNHVFSAMGTSWSTYPSDGVSIINISTGLNDDEFTQHSQAYQQWYMLNQYIQSKGWKPMIYEPNPRLMGEDAKRYLFESEFRTGHILDPQIKLSFAEWQKLFNEISSVYTSYYADGVFLTIDLRRRNIRQEDFDGIYQRPDLKSEQWGQYTVDITLESVLYKIRNGIHNRFIADDNEHNPQKLSQEQDKLSADLVGNYKKMYMQDLERRYKEEAELKKQGYKINEDYQDPDLIPYLRGKK